MPLQSANIAGSLYFTWEGRSLKVQYPQPACLHPAGASEGKNLRNSKQINKQRNMKIQNWVLYQTWEKKRCSLEGVPAKGIVCMLNIRASVGEWEGTEFFPACLHSICLTWLSPSLNYMEDSRWIFQWIPLSSHFKLKSNWDFNFLSTLNCLKKAKWFFFLKPWVGADRSEFLCPCPKLAIYGTHNTLHKLRSLWRFEVSCSLNNNREN